MSAYDALVARGCLCGTERPQACTLHGPNDLRGLAAFFKAGMPAAFPMVATCAICRSEGLMYPNVNIDDKRGSGEFKPTLVCPTCSKPAAEWALRAECETFGHKLNDRAVFGGGLAVAA